MGMFDYVDYSCKCPNCETRVTGFQSKGYRCVLATIPPWKVDNFYAPCDNCGSWIRFLWDENEEEWNGTLKDGTTTMSFNINPPIPKRPVEEDLRQQINELTDRIRTLEDRESELLDRIIDLEISIEKSL
jgi:hypothetical protein